MLVLITSFAIKSTNLLLPCRCLYWNTPWVIILMTVSGLSGVVVFAFYALENCDPLSNGDIDNINQVGVVDIQ